MSRTLSLLSYWDAIPVTWGTAGCGCPADNDRQLQTRLAAPVTSAGGGHHGAAAGQPGGGAPPAAGRVF
jgi:hypothetical protein